jgi:hypothetical protein
MAGSLTVSNQSVIHFPLLASLEPRIRKIFAYKNIHSLTER